MILNERDSRHEQVLQIAQQMMIAARTAPKAKGVDIIEVAMVTDPVLPKNMVIHRLTGDGPKNILAAPLWTADKKRVLNTLTHYLKENKIYQGKDYEH